MTARPAPPLRAVAALTAIELRLAARRGENVLVMLVIPVAVLLFFGGTSLGAGLGATQGSIVTGSIALGLIAAGLVNLGIATAYERQYGVLKRLGGAPISRSVFVAAKVAAVLVIEAVQVAVLTGVANLVFGWTPGPSWSPSLFVIAVGLGTVAFVAIGLLLAGALRAEVVLALANGLFLAFLMLGGLIVPLDELPSMLKPISAALPATALADVLRVSLDSGTGPGGTSDLVAPFALLAVWAALAAATAAAAFRWEE